MSLTSAAAARSRWSPWSLEVAVAPRDPQVLCDLWGMGGIRQSQQDPPVSSKASWEAPTPRTDPVVLPPDVERVIARAEQLTRREIVRLDLAERRDHDVLLAGWDFLRSALGEAKTRELRLTVRTRAWDAVGLALRRLGIDPVVDDGAYWLVKEQIGAGAARAARFAACALIAPDRVDPDVAEILLRPWRSVIWAEVSAHEHAGHPSA